MKRSPLYSYILAVTLSFAVKSEKLKRYVERIAPPSSIAPKISLSQCTPESILPITRNSIRTKFTEISVILSQVFSIYLHIWKNAVEKNTIDKRVVEDG